MALNGYLTDSEQQLQLSRESRTKTFVSGPAFCGESLEATKSAHGNLPFTLVFGI
jgi:hypothetical protein